MTATAPPPTYAQCEMIFFARLRELGFNPETIFDIGGSNGAWSTSIVEVFPDARFELFEPLAGRYRPYQRVLDWCLDKHAGFRVHPIALGAHNGEAEFWAEPNAVGSSLLVSNVPNDQKIRVPIRRLDDAVAELGLEQPQIIKMDVQGGEALVIAGGAKTIEAAEVLHVETWLRRGYGQSTPLLTELIQTLRPMGFFLVYLGDFYRSPEQELVSVDAFFVHRRLIDRLRSGGRGYPWPACWDGPPPSPSQAEGVRF